MHSANKTLFANPDSDEDILFVNWILTWGENYKLNILLLHLDSHFTKVYPCEGRRNCNSNLVVHVYRSYPKEHTHLYEGFSQPSFLKNCSHFLSELQPHPHYLAPDTGHPVAPLQMLQASLSNLPCQPLLLFKNARLHATTKHMLRFCEDLTLQTFSES